MTYIDLFAYVSIKGQFTMTTSKAGRVIKPRAEFRCVDHWMPTELKSSLKVFYRMGNELREMGFKLRPFKMLAPAGDTSKQEDSGKDSVSHVSSVTARSSTRDAPRLGRKRPHTSMSVDVMSLEDDTQPGSSSWGYRGSQDNTQPGPSSRGYRDSEDNTQPGPSSRGFRDERDHTQPDSSSRGYRNSQSRRNKLSQNETMSANSGQHGVRLEHGFRTISHVGQSNLTNYEKTVKNEVDADGWPTADVRNQATEEDDGNEIVVIDITSSDDEGCDDMFIVEQPRVETEAIDVEIDDEDKSLNRSGDLTGKKTNRESTGMNERKRNVKECRVKIRTRNKTEIEKRIDEEKSEMEIGNRIDEEESKRVDAVKNLNDIANDGTIVKKDTSDGLEPADDMETDEIADEVKMIAKEENVSICKQGQDKVVDAGMSKENDVETNDPGDTEVDKGVSKQSVEEINVPKEPSANDINECIEESPFVVVIPRSENCNEVSNVTNLDLVKGNEISEQEEGVDEPSQITEQEREDVSQRVQPSTDVECDAADTIKSSEVASELRELPIDGLELPREGQELNNLSNQASGDSTNGPTESDTTTEVDKLSGGPRDSESSLVENNAV